MKYKRFIEVIWLPTALTFLLVAETLFFNLYFNIASGMYIWHCIFASVSLSAAIFFPAAFFTKRKSKFIYLSLISALVAAIFISQFLYYKFSGGFMQASSLGYARQAVEVMGTIKTLLAWKLLIFLIPLGVVVGGYFFVGKGQEEVWLSVKEKFIAFFLILIFIFGGYGTVVIMERDQFGNAGRLYNSQQMYDLSTLVAKIGIVNFYLENFAEWAFSPSIATQEDKTFLADFAQNRTLPAQGKDFGVFKGKNLIFIQVESLENWVIGYKINGVLVAPNLTALSQEGTYFTNYYSQDGVGNTADAEFSTLNSLYPLPDSVAFITHATNQYAALPALLDKNGYITSVMHGDVPAFWNRANAYPPLGYEKQFSQSDYTIPRPVGFEDLGDDDFFKESLPKLESLAQPFMATLITLSTHTPFALPADLETLAIPKDTSLTPTQQQYLEAVHYSDQAIGNFIAGLKADGLYSKSVIFIFGDHSAFIGTDDSETQHVPLIMLAANNPFAGVNTAPGSHLDLYTTAADLLGIQYPITVLGQDLFNTQTPIVTQRAPGTGSIKFIISSNLKYTGSADGIFGDGSCIALPASTTLPIAACKAMYDEEASTTKASDIVVRYNLLSLLNTQK